MALIASEVMATIAADSIYSTAISGSKWFLGNSLIKRRTDIVGSPNFIGPCTTAAARPFETSAAIPGWMPWAVQWSPNIDWIFLADQTAAATTVRKLQLYEFDRQYSTFSWKGYIFLAPRMLNAAGKTSTFLMKGFRMDYATYAAGKVCAVLNQSIVAGDSTAGTQWVTQKCAIPGNRIGFGDTRPWKISTWYNIVNVAGDTKLTVTPNLATTISAPSSYVIEDLRAYFTSIGGTVGHSGLYIVKGMAYNHFKSVPIIGDTYMPATTVADTKGCFWLRAPTLSGAMAYAASGDTGCAGIGKKDKDTWLQQWVYTLSTPAALNYKIAKYNVRAALSLRDGGDTAAWSLTTGSQAHTGTVVQNNNLRLATLNHGPGAGVSCLYYLTASRINRALELSITSGNVSFKADEMTEVPPGGVATYALTGALSTLEVASTIDRLIVMSSSTAGTRSYITNYNAGNNEMDHVFTIDDKQIDQVGVNNTTAPHATTLSAIQYPWVEGGMLYMFGTGVSAVTNIGHAFPVGADWTYSGTTHQYLVTPKILTPNCNNYQRVYVLRDRLIGGTGGDLLGQPPDPIKIYYRTNTTLINFGDTGGWTLVADGNDISGIAGSSYIQFRLDFRTISDKCIPARIFGLGVVYNDISTDSHYQPSVANSNITTKAFAWRFATSWGSTVPTLRVRIYNAISGGLLIDDTTAASASGTWYKSTTNGLSWGGYTTTDRSGDSTYIRYVPTVLADNITVKAVLTQ